MRRPPTSTPSAHTSVQAVAGYFDNVADELGRRGHAVDMVEIDARPLSGRLVVATGGHPYGHGRRPAVVLSWQQDTGWSGRSPGGGITPTAGPAADPRDVARIVQEFTS